MLLAKTSNHVNIWRWQGQYTAAPPSESNATDRDLRLTPARIDVAKESLPEQLSGPVSG